MQENASLQNDLISIRKLQSMFFDAEKTIKRYQTNIIQSYEQARADKIFELRGALPSMQPPGFVAVQYCCIDMYGSIIRENRKM